MNWYWHAAERTLLCLETGAQLDVKESGSGGYYIEYRVNQQGMFLDRDLCDYAVEQVYDLDKFETKEEAELHLKEIAHRIGTLNFEKMHKTL